MDYICREVRRIVKKYDETDLLALARALGITVRFKPLGRKETSLKGLFTYNWRRKYIVINSDMPYKFQMFVLAHEIGHSVLHLKAAELQMFKDIFLGSNLGIYETEANLFAAELMLFDNSKVIETLKSGLTFMECADELCVLPEALDFKCRILRKQGLLDANVPVATPGDFLRKPFQTEELCPFDY